jgi:hypothetical protein
MRLRSGMEKYTVFSYSVAWASKGYFEADVSVSVGHRPACLESDTKKPTSWLTRSAVFASSALISRYVPHDFSPLRSAQVVKNSAASA